MADVLVVGAGPVGLTMASELARHGVRARIIDRLASPLPWCRAIGVTPRTLEVFDDMGVVREIVDAGLWLEGLRLIVDDHPPRDIYGDLSDLPYGELGIRQPETERILTQHLARSGVAVERGATLVSLSPAAGGARVEIEHVDGRREQAAFRYVVGCDGAHSAVRHALGIPFEGEAFEMGFMLGEVSLDAGLPRGLALRAMKLRENDAPDMFIAIPLPEPERYRVSSLAPAEAGVAPSSDHGLQAGRPGPSLADLQAVADRVLPFRATLSDMSWSSHFRISMRLAARYRQDGVFLAGDAAHIHPPTGGQGMNTGIQDAYNLAWKLALVTRGHAPVTLLDSYEAERRPVGADVIARTVAASTNLGRPGGEKPHRLADTQLLVSYRGGPLAAESLSSPVPDDAPRAGDRAPPAAGLMRAHVGFPMRLADILRGAEFVLLAWIGDDDEVPALEQAASAARALYGSLIRVVAITGPSVAMVDIPGVPVYRDGAGSFADAYLPTPGAAWLVRPDGYIGWHGRPWGSADLVGYLAACLKPAP
jgi:2-polyprenyl-6-methoxyphenol hydroxylase-like FAD-dependent oxidoreductase